MTVTLAPWRAAARVVDDDRPGPCRRAPDPIDVDDLLAEPDDDYDWVIPGLLERRDRLIVTGGEGAGKPTLLRQIGVRAASGLHPFTEDDIDPLGVFVVDAENSRAQSKRALRPLRQAAGRRYERGRLRYEFSGDGIDLTSRADVDWLHQALEQTRADVLVAGPLYKLAAGDPVKEEVTRLVAFALDEIRDAHGVAVILEAHVPHADTARGARPERPYGGSLWLRWPEFGIYLAADGALRHWRGPRDERAWPARLGRSKPWPWTAVQATEAVPWDGPSHCMDDLERVLADVAPAELSVRQLRDLLSARGGGYRHATVGEAVERLAVQGRATVRVGPRSARLFRHAERSDDDF